MPSKTINFANDVWQIVTFGPMINVRKCIEVIYINNACARFNNKKFSS